MPEDSGIVIANQVSEELAKPKVYKLTIEFAPELQGVNIVFDNTEYRTFDYILGIIEMAKRRCEFLAQQSMALQMQAQMESQMLKQQILGKRR